MKVFNSLKFSITLKVWRNMNAISSADMADMSGVARSTYGFIETQDRCPTIAELVNLSNTIQFDPTEFFTDDKVKK